MRLKSLFLALLLISALPACGSEDKPAESGDEPEGQSVSKEITAAEGGEVVIGEAALDIPAALFPTTRRSPSRRAPRAALSRIRAA